MCVTYSVMLPPAMFNRIAFVALLHNVQPTELYCSEIKILFPSIIVELGGGTNTRLVPVPFVCQWGHAPCLPPSLRH